MSRPEPLAAEAVEAGWVERRIAAMPDCAELLATVEDRLARLWERRITDPDALLLRIGLGHLSAQIRVVDGSEPGPGAERTVGDVPLGVPLSQVGVVGVAGARAEVASLARSLVAQLAGWHSPRDVRLVVLADSDATLADWRWASLLPHSRPEPVVAAYSSVGSLDRPDQVRRRVTELELLLADRRATRSGDSPPPRPAVVVLLDGARRLRGVPGIARLLADGPAVGILAICLDGSRSGLPVECRAYAELISPGSAADVEALVTMTDGPAQTVVSDGVSLAWAERFGRAAAPLRDSTPDDTATGSAWTAATWIC